MLKNIIVYSLNKRYFWTHFTYHEDGLFHYRLNLINKYPDLNVEKRRQQLSLLKGPESLVQFNVIKNDLIGKKKIQPRLQDVVIQTNPPFGVEIIISDKILNLPKLPLKNTKKFTLLN